MILADTHFTTKLSYNTPVPYSKNLLQPGRDETIKRQKKGNTCEEEGTLLFWTCVGIFPVPSHTPGKKKPHALGFPSS